MTIAALTVTGEEPDTMRRIPLEVHANMRGAIVAEVMAAHGLRVEVHGFEIFGFIGPWKVDVDVAWLEVVPHLEPVPFATTAPTVRACIDDLESTLGVFGRVIVGGKSEKHALLDIAGRVVATVLEDGTHDLGWGRVEMRWWPRSVDLPRTWPACPTEVACDEAERRFAAMFPAYCLWPEWEPGAEKLGPGAWLGGPRGYHAEVRKGAPPATYEEWREHYPTAIEEPSGHLVAVEWVSSVADRASEHDLKRVHAELRKARIYTDGSWQRVPGGWRIRAHDGGRKVVEAVAAWGRLAQLRATEPAHYVVTLERYMRASMPARACRRDDREACLDTVNASAPTTRAVAGYVDGSGEIHFASEAARARFFEKLGARQ